MSPDPNWKAKKNPEVWRRANRAYAASAHGKRVIAAKSKIRTKVRNGTLKKPSACPVCHRTGVRLVWHHTKGHNQDTGRWLCDLDHARLDPARSGKRIGAAVKRSLAAKKKS